MLGPDCNVDPLASEDTYGSGFSEQFRGLFGCTVPADLALFREMLPAKFEMPRDPQVCFYAIDFIVGSLGPYHEVALLLPVTYAGETGKYVLSMALDSSNNTEVIQVASAKKGTWTVDVVASSVSSPGKQDFALAAVLV